MSLCPFPILPTAVDSTLASVLLKETGTPRHLPIPKEKNSWEEAESKGEWVGFVQKAELLS